MRRFALLLTLVALLWSIATPSHAQEGGDTTLYSTVDGTFQFVYPSSWAAASASAGEVVLAPSDAALAKTLTELSSGEFSLEVRSPLFTERFAGDGVTLATDVVTSIQGRLGTGFTPVGDITTTTYGPYAVARLDLSVEGLDMVIVAAQLTDDAVSLVFGFARGGERAILDTPIAGVVASMVYTPVALDVASLPVITQANGDQLDNVMIWGGHTTGIRTVAFSPDGRLAASADNTSVIIVRDAATGEEFVRIASPRIISAGPAFSADGNFMLFGSPDGTIWEWNLTESRVEREWGPVGDTVWDVIYSPDGQTIAAASADLTVRVWLAASNTPIAILTGHRNDIVSLAFDATSSWLVSGSLDGTVRVWDIKTAETIMTLLGPSQGVVSVAISPDRKLIAAGGATGSLQVWDSSTQAERYNIAPESESLDAVTGVAFNAEGTLLASSRDNGTVLVVEADPGSPVITLSGPTLMNDIAFSPDGRLLVVADESGVLLVWGVVEED